MVSWLLVLFLTPLAVFASFWIRSRIALPLLTTLAVYFPFAMEAQNSLLHAFLILVLWTVLLSFLVLSLTIQKPEEMKLLVWRGEEYANTMFQWIATGELPEGSRKNVVKIHLRQAMVYCIVSFVTANFLALALGSALLNYMNYYVARLAATSLDRSKALRMGWNPWSVIRVAAFLALGIMAGLPLMSLLFSVNGRFSLALLIAGVAGVLLDIILKLSLSKTWSAKLKANLIG